MQRQTITAKLVLQFLMQIGRWSQIYPYLEKNGYQKKPNEKPHKKALLDNETAIICLVIYTNLYYENERFSVRSLAKQLDSTDEKATNAKARKVRRLLSSIEQYNIINFYTDKHEGNRQCIRVEATDLLINFIETHLFNYKESL